MDSSVLHSFAQNPAHQRSCSQMKYLLGPTLELNLEAVDRISWAGKCARASKILVFFLALT